MEIEISTRSKNLQLLLPKLAKFYASKLNISNSKFKLLIYTDPSIKAEGNNGLCFRTGPKHISVALYSRLNPTQLLYTLAHEMVHVKQMCRGQYTCKATKYGKSINTFWLGKKVVADYFDRPWEKEAFRRQEFLVQELSETIQLKKKKKVDKK